MMTCVTNKFFCNKIWQASKYILLTTSEKQYQEPEYITLLDRWILSQLSITVQIVNQALSNRDFHKAVASVKSFVHYQFCDLYLVSL